jgi:hypothetical protein
VNKDPGGLDRFGGAQQIRGLPNGLKIVQRGANPNHYEIVPTEPMSPADYQQLLNKVQF